MRAGLHLHQATPRCRHLGSSPPPASSPEVSSWGSSLPIHEHDKSYVGFLVVDLSLGEEDAFPNTSWDEKIARKIFGDLNRGLLGPLEDGNMIILSDSDEEEEEVHEDYRTIFCGRLTAPTTSVAADYDAPDGCKMIVVAVAPLIWCKMIIVMVETRPVHLRLPHQKGRMHEACIEEFKNNNDSSMPSHKFFCKGEWGW
jgi:hypothetical protein